MVLGHIFIETLDKNMRESGLMTCGKGEEHIQQEIPAKL